MYGKQGEKRTFGHWLLRHAGGVPAGGGGVRLGPAAGPGGPAAPAGGDASGPRVAAGGNAGGAASDSGDFGAGAGAGPAKGNQGAAGGGGGSHACGGGSPPSGGDTAAGGCADGFFHGGAGIQSYFGRLAYPQRRGHRRPAGNHGTGGLRRGGAVGDGRSPDGHHRGAGA